MKSELHELPELGHSEVSYANHAHRAYKAADFVAKDAYKVAHYVTLAMNRNLDWSERLKMFKHAISHHTIAPPYADTEMYEYYKKLTLLVQTYCSAEALRLVSHADDDFARRSQTTAKSMLSRETEAFFSRFVSGEECPEWYLPDDYYAMRLIAQQWKRPLEPGAGSASAQVYHR